MTKSLFSGAMSISEKAGLVEKRYGATTKGAANKVKPKLKLRPSGNPLKGSIGIKGKLTF